MAKMGIARRGLRLPTFFRLACATSPETSSALPESRKADFDFMIKILQVVKKAAYKVVCKKFVVFVAIFLWLWRGTWRGGRRDVQGTHTIPWSRSAEISAIENFISDISDIIPLKRVIWIFWIAMQTSKQVAHTSYEIESNLRIMLCLCPQKLWVPLLN